MPLRQFLPAARISAQTKNRRHDGKIRRQYNEPTIDGLTIKFRKHRSLDIHLGSEQATCVRLLV
jgi:hypothetical protein